MIDLCCSACRPWDQDLRCLLFMLDEVLISSCIESDCCILPGARGGENFISEFVGLWYVSSCAHQFYGSKQAGTIAFGIRNALMLLWILNSKQLN